MSQKTSNAVAVHQIDHEQFKNLALAVDSIRAILEEMVQDPCDPSTWCHLLEGLQGYDDKVMEYLDGGRKRPLTENMKRRAKSR